MVWVVRGPWCGAVCGLGCVWCRTVAPAAGLYCPCSPVVEGNHEVLVEAHRGHTVGPMIELHVHHAALVETLEH